MAVIEGGQAPRYWCVHCPGDEPIRVRDGATEAPYWLHTRTETAQCPTGTSRALPRGPVSRDRGPRSRWGA